MNHIEQAAEKVALLMDAGFEVHAGECLIKKKRELKISAEKSCFNCSFELDISFKKYKENGIASNQADILLLPEELPAFIYAWTEHEIALPMNYRQRCEMNPNIVCVYLETSEPPEDFAARLSAALAVLEEGFEDQFPQMIN